MGVSFGLVLYWYLKHGFTKFVLVYSFVAYFGAIALKYVTQTLTLNYYVGFVGSNPYALGLYFGSLTVVFEVLGAYLVARYATSRGKLFLNDAMPYGLGLSLWENGLLTSLLVLINYISYYALLSSPSTHDKVYALLIAHYPELFLPPVQALPLVGVAVVECRP